MGHVSQCPVAIYQLKDQPKPTERDHLVHLLELGGDDGETGHEVSQSLLPR